MKGATGAANDFSLTSVSGDDLADFAWAGTDSATMVSMAAPQNAIIKIDGVEQHYASNTVDTAIANLRIDLNKAAPGTTVTLATSEPTTTMRDLMVEFVEAYNTLMKGLNTATATGADSTSSGVLNGEASIRDMRRQLATMTSTSLTATGSYKTLSDLGIATNRDGTLKLDTDILDKAIAADPSAVVQMLNPAVSSTTNPGLAGMMDAVRDKIQQKDGSLAIATSKYKDLAEKLTEQLEKLDTQMTNYEAQLTTVYSKMETRLTALKATQSYLEQQIEIWNNSDS
jgi:flagellar hook-associated protein 2